METQKIWNAAIYVRISKENDDDTLENQRSIIMNYLSGFNDIQVRSIKVDDGYSGLNVNRPAFQEMLREIETGTINCVVVRDLSRLSRNYIDAGRYVKIIFPALGVRFISVLEGLDIMDRLEDNPYLLVMFKNLINEEYLRQISRSTKSSLQNSYIQGKYMGASPIYGYRRSPADRYKLEIDPNAAEVVKTIFQWKLEGMSAASISDKLNKSGILSPEEYKKSNLPEDTKDFKKKSLPKWSPNVIIRILSNKVYIGRLEQGKTEKPYFKALRRETKPEDQWYCVENAHQPIIDNQVYAAVIRLLRMDTRIPPGENATIVYAGFVRCGNCGQNMTQRRNTYNGRKYYYYICRSKDAEGRKCAGYHIPRPILEQEIFNQIQNHINEVLCIRDLLPKINTAAIRESCLKKTAKTLDILNVHLSRYKNVLKSLEGEGADKLLTKTEQSEVKHAYMEKCRRIEKCIHYVCKKADIMGSENYFSDWTDRYMLFIPFSAVTRPFLAFFVKKIIVDKKRGFM